MSINSTIKTGSDAGRISQLCDYALESEAVNHTYLNALKRGELPNMEMALKDFAFQYGLYCADFTQYLNTVIQKLDDPEHKQILLSNLDAEEGNAHDVELPPDVLASIDGLTHAELFRQFQEAVGANGRHGDSAAECDPGSTWSRQFSTLCEMNALVGIGAIGIGTEFIVSHIYNQILEALRAHSGLTAIQRVFFDLHSECDDEHGAQMKKIAEDLARDPESTQQIEYGVMESIKIRKAFWDTLLERALSFSTSPTP